MIKYIFISIIILITLAPTIFSQSNTQLFSDYLPEKYLIDEDKLEQLEETLDRFAKVNPDLIYYYLNYLNYITEQGIYDRDSNYYNILQYENSLSIHYNNEWIEREINRAQKLSESAYIVGELESYLEEFQIPQIKVSAYSIKLPVDKNLQKFFSYKYLTRDTSLVYNGDINYQDAVEVAIQNIVSQIQSDYKANGVNSYDKHESNYELLLKNHVFSKGFSNGSGYREDFYIADYLLLLIDYSDFRVHPGIKVGVSLGNMIYNLSEVEVTEVYLPYHQFHLGNTENESQFYNLTVGYRFKLKEYITEFCYLDVNLGWSFLDQTDPGSSEEINQYYFFWEGEPGDFTLLFNGTVESISWEVKRYSELTVNINIPVFYLFRKLFFELGLEYHYGFAEYTIQVERDITEQIAPDPSILGPEIERLEHQFNNHVFSGRLTINYSIINSLNIKGVISTYPSIQIGLEYLLNL